MDSATSQNISLYAAGSKQVCICTTVSIFLILLFIVSPLNRVFMASILGKCAIVLILAFALYKNYTITKSFSSETNTTVMGTGPWTNTKMNITCSYLFSFFIFVLLISVLRKFL